MIMYDFDWTIASLVIDIHTTQFAQVTLFDILGATHPQHDPWRLVLRSGLRGVSPGRLPELGYRMTVVPEGSIGNFLNGIQTFVDDQDRVNDTRSVQVRKRKRSFVTISLMKITDQGPRQLQVSTTHQGLPFTEWCHLAVRSGKPYPPPWP